MKILNKRGGDAERIYRIFFCDKIIASIKKRRMAITVKQYYYFYYLKCLLDFYIIFL